MATSKTIFLYKWGVFHLDVSSKESTSVRLAIFMKHEALLTISCPSAGSPGMYDLEAFWYTSRHSASYAS